MEQSELKQQLQQYLETGDERLLHILLAVAAAYTDTSDSDVIPELERRRARRLSSESKIYSWEEAKQYITGTEPFPKDF